MGKAMLTGPMRAAIERGIRDQMPDLDTTLKSIEESLRSLQGDLRRVEKSLHDELRRLDAKVDSLREEMLDRFERQLALINETNDRVTKLEGKLEGYMEALRLFVAPGTPVRPSSRKRVG